MRLTIDHVRQAPQFVNTMLQREIDLRGMKLSSLDEKVLLRLENTFDAINLSSNALVSLDYFPLTTLTKSGTSDSTGMSRIETLVVHRNQLRKVSVKTCVLALPNVRHFLADQNSFKRLEDITFLKFWKNLEVVSFEHNPLFSSTAGETLEKTRAFIVFMCPRVKLINYERVTEKDRTAAKTFKKEFDVLLGSLASEVGDGNSTDKKIRKRGRANRSEASTDKKSKSDPSGTEVDLQARYEYISQRMSDPNITPEEFEALEKELSVIIENQ